MLRHRRILSFTRIQLSSQSRMRTLFLTSTCVFLLLLIYLLFPWCCTIWVWRSSNIEYSDIVKNTGPSTIRVPRIIHQTWKDRETIPPLWQNASNKCKYLHPNYEYHLWTDKEGRDLIRDEFPLLLDTFDAYPYDIQRADVIRLVTLYVYGGIYLDLDIVCLQSLDPLLKYDLVLPKTRPVGLSNDFMIARPQHPFLYQVLNDLPNHQLDLISKYGTVMFSTGPMFLTHQATKYEHRSSIGVLSSELYGKYVFNESRSMFRHLKGSSWHGNDALLIRWFYHRRNLFFHAFIVFFFVVFLFLNLVYRHQIINTLRSYPLGDKTNTRSYFPISKHNSVDYV